MRQRMLWLAAATLGLVSYLPADDAAKGGDRERLQGAWTVVAAEREGKPSDRSNGDRLVFEGDQFILKTQKGEMKGTYKLNPSASPKTIDMAMAEGPQKDKTAEGIYSLQGGTLKICLADAATKQRPTTFLTKPGSRQTLFELKREKP